MAFRQSQAGLVTTYWPNSPTSGGCSNARRGRLRTEPGREVGNQSRRAGPVAHYGDTSESRIALYSV
jgi:hypothetical protein